MRIASQDQCVERPFFRIAERANEAAEILGIPVGTVKSRVYYALRALRVVLAERGVPV